MFSAVEACQFSSWWPRNKRLVPKTRVLECPEEFRTFLLADGIQLGEQSAGESDADSSSQSDAESSEESDASDAASDAENAPIPPAQFHQQITNTIAELDGAVCPKLNWSAPKDAVWMSPTNNMKCINANDVYMLLKASDYCTFDLTQAYGDRGPEKLVLVLREWFDIVPSMEFRCFVRNNKLIAATQRDMNYYEFLHTERAAIQRLLQGLLPQISFDLGDFVFDAYIPRSLNRVWLVDINPFMDRTDSLMFDWDDLKTRDEFELRLISKQDATRDFSSKPHSTNYVPHDFVGLSQEETVQLFKETREAHKKLEN